MPKEKSSSTLIIVLLLSTVGVSLFCCCPAMLLPAVMSAREAARRMECSNNLKQIGLAMWSYRSMNGDYPPAYVADEHGNPLYSWRVLLLPFMEQTYLYNQFDFESAWDSPANLAVTETTMQVFQCPSKSPRTEPFTDYMVVVGPETMFPGAESTGPHDIRDGQSNTIMVVEVLDTGVHWTEPRDITMDDLLAKGINGHDETGCGSHHPGGVMVGLADGSVHFFEEDISSDLFRSLLTRSGGEVVSLP